LVGEVFTVGLYGVSTGAPDQTSAGQVILTWDTTYVQMSGLNVAGAPSYLSSGFLGDPFGLNASITDGNAMWIYFAMPASPVTATPAGTLLMGFHFTALAPTAPATLIDIAATAGSPTGQTIIYDSVVPNTSITGTLAGTTMQVLVPGPTAISVLALGAFVGGARRRRVPT
jgi:hypothetical protein